MDKVAGFCSHFQELLPSGWLTPAPQSAPGGCNHQNTGLGNKAALQSARERSGWDFFLSFVFSSLIKMILVSELPPIVKTTQKPNVYSRLIIIFLSCD